MATNLINKAKLGLKWTMIKTLFNSLVQPLYRILLAIILAPSEFAYISVILLIISFAELLNNVGIGEAVIQREKVTTKDLSSLFFFNLFITGIIALILYNLSFYIKSYYEMKYLDVIVKILVITIIINGSTSLFKFYLHKEFYFKETAIINIIKNVIEILLVTTLILLDKGIWGFLFGIITANMINGILITFLVFTKTNFKLEWYFSIKNLWKFLSFGSSIAAKKILTFFSHRIDEIIIGGVLSSSFLGSYYLAKNILNQIQSLLTNAFGQVLLPMFSKIKYNKVKLKHYYLKMLALIGFIGFPIFVGIVATADLFVPVIFGEEWSESILVFQVLPISILAMLLSAGVSTSLLYSINKAVLLLKIDIITIIIYITFLMLFNNGKLLNILIIYTIYMLSKFIIIQYFIGKEFEISIKNYLASWKNTFIVTILMLTVVIVYKTIFDQIMSEIFILIISVGLGIIIYVIMSILFNKKQFKELLRLLKDII